MCVSVAVLVMSLGMPCLAKKHQTPLDPRIIGAKSVYIKDLGSSKTADEAYSELKKWKRWEIVGERLNADLILALTSEEAQSLTGEAPTYNPNMKTGSRRTGGSVHMELFDSNRGESIFADTNKTVHDIIRELAKRIEKEEKRANNQALVGCPSFHSS